MKNIQPLALETASVKPVKHLITNAILLMITMLIAGILPVWSFAQAPTIVNFTPATGPVGTLVTITGTNLSDPTALTIGGQSAIVVSNDGSNLVAMVMPGAVTGGVSLTTAGGTASGSSNFTETPTPYPNSQQGNKLVPADNVGIDTHGWSIGISADGNTAIVGGNQDNNQQGAAWIYTRSGGAWTQQGPKLVGNDNTGPANQGVSVALSADGNTALVGGYADNTPNGAAWVFTRSGGVWTQQGPKLVPNDNTGPAQLGNAVSLSADGNTALIGGYGDNGSHGAVWVFTRSGGVWTQQGPKLVGTGGSSSAQEGVSVAVSADGNTAIFGESGDAYPEGVWIFARSGGVWTQQGSKIIGTGSVGYSAQGSSVALSADGNTAMVGAEADNSLGAAWVFTRSGGIWTQQGAKLVGTGGFNADEGQSVSLSADGNTAIIGGGNDDNVGTGAVWVFIRSGGNWIQQGSKMLGTGSVGNSGLGWSAAMSADGTTAIAGAPFDNGSTGAAFVYIVTPPPAISSFSPATGPVGTLVTITGTNLNTTTSVIIGGVSAIIVSNNGSTLVAMVMPGAVTGGVTLTTVGGSASGIGNFIVTATPYPSAQQGVKLTDNSSADGEQGWSVSLSADGNTAIVGGPEDNNNQGAVWIYTRSGATWSQQAKLTDNSSTTAQQGIAAAISADGNTAIVGGHFDNDEQGAAWIYTRSGTTWSQQGAKLVGTGSTVGDQGWSVSISADGNTAIVGGYSDNNDVGAAWIYTRSGGTWSQQARLVGSGNAGASEQGRSVALSADGNTAIVGGDQDNLTGAAWVFTRSGGTWAQQGAKLVASDATSFAQQGHSVALSADGNTAMVGGVGDNNVQGAAWVYTRSGGTWTQQGSKLVGTGGTGVTLQGQSVSLSADGNTAIVGGADDNSELGAAWVYTRSGTTWTQQGSKLVGNNYVGAAQQGWSVAVSADGTTGIVGGFRDNNMGVPSQGASWVYIVGAPSGQAMVVNVSNAGPAAITVNWTNGTGAFRAVFMAQVSSGAPAPVNGTTYTSSNTFGSGTQIGNSGWFCIYNGSGSTVNVSGLTAATTYRVMVVEYNGTPGAEQYLTTPGTGNPGNITTLSSSDATLSNLVSSSGPFDQPFAPGTTTYTTSVPNTTTAITLTPTATTGSTASITINSAPVASGSPSGSLGLNVGSNTFTIVVTAQDGKTTDTYTVTVTRALTPTTITFNALPAKTYGNADFSPGATSNNNAVPITYSSDNTNVATIVNGNIHIVAAGTANITASQAGDATHLPANDVIRALTVSPAQLTITANDVNKAYGATLTDGTSSTGFTATGLAYGQTISVTLTYGTGSAATAAVGTYTGQVTPSAATGSGFIASNYIITYVKGNIIVGKAALIITANNVQKTYGTFLFSGFESNAFTSTGLANGQTIDRVTISYGTGAAATAAAGTYNGQVTPSDAEGGTFTPANYSITYVNGNITVDQAHLTITADNVYKTYGTTLTGGPGSRAFTASGLVNFEIINSVTIAFGTGSAATAAVGTYTGQVTPSAPVGSNGFSSSNYSIDYVTGNIIVRKALLTITANNQTKEKGSPNPPLTVSYSGFENGDSPSSLTTLPSVNTIATTNSPPGIYLITANGAVANNYAFTYVPGVLTVVKGKAVALMSVNNPADNSLLAESEPVVNQAVSPNGDGINDFLYIKNIESYPDNRLVLLNRAGNEIFNVSGYDNINKVFDGHSNIDKTMQRPGTYFYLLEYAIKGELKRKTGFFIIKY